MRKTPLKLHSGKAFGRILWYQIQSYCGDFTPKFYTKEMGVRNLALGCCGDMNPVPGDGYFAPWQFEWTQPLAEEIQASALPQSFADFKQKLSQITVQPSNRVAFTSQSSDLNQASGFIKINGILRHQDYIITLGMGIPMLMKLQEDGAISLTEALYLTEAMVGAGVTEIVTDESYAQIRRRSHEYRARFAWEAYHTIDAIEHTH